MTTTQTSPKSPERTRSDSPSTPWNTRGKNNTRYKRTYNKNQQTKKIKIIYANVNGMTSKQKSIENICIIEKPHILACAETKTDILPLIPEYMWITTNKPGQKGGVAIATRNDIRKKVSETRENNPAINNMEITWITLAISVNEKIHVGTMYGKQNKRAIISMIPKKNTMS